MKKPALDTFKNPLSLLQKNDKLTYVLHKAQQLKAYNQVLQNVIQAPHVYVLNIDNKTMTIGANNASVASRLRMLTPQIKHAFALRGVEINAVKTTIFIRPLKPHAPPKKPRTISPVARQTLDAIHKLLKE